MKRQEEKQVDLVNETVDLEEVRCMCAHDHPDGAAAMLYSAAQDAVDAFKQTDLGEMRAQLEYAKHHAEEAVCCLDEALSLLPEEHDDGAGVESNG